MFEPELNWQLTFCTEEREMHFTMRQQPWLEAIETVLLLAARLETTEEYRRVAQGEDYVLLVKRYNPDKWFVIRLDPVQLPVYRVQSFQLEAAV